MNRVKKLLFTAIIFVLFLNFNHIAVQAAEFPDVASGSWYYSCVQYMSEKGIMNGYTNGLFGPSDPLTRGQFATMIYRLEKSPDVEYTSKFSDVPEGQFFSLPVTWASEKNIITGYSDTHQFGPNDCITREQIVTILYRYANGKDYDMSAGSIDYFPDAYRVSAFAKDAVGWAVKQRLLTGDKGYINPQGNAGRAEVATILRRFIGIKEPVTTSALHVAGTRLVGEDGRPVQLRGVSTHGIAWFPGYINAECFKDLKEKWNANVVRLAMYTAEYNGYCTGGNQEYLKTLVKNGIRCAADQGLYVIVDWHILSDANPNTYKEVAKAFFNEIAAEFSDADNILYEICNEPNGGTSWNDIKAYAQEIIPVIRNHDKDAVIIVGTPNWSQYVDQAAASPITGYDNLMYSLHFYAGTHKQDLRDKMTNAVLAGLPVFVTEYGICDASGNGALDIAEADKWVAEMDKLGVSYVAWNLSNKAESSAMLNPSCTKTSGFTESDLSAGGRWLYTTLNKHRD